MGQRSQIYVRCNIGKKKTLIANYYQWNFRERMISRARHSIEHILIHLDYGEWYFNDKNNITKISRFLDTNFDMCDIATSCNIIKEHTEEFPEYNFNDYVFRMQDNNDGKLIIDIYKDKVKYAFLDYDANSDNIMNAEEYMDWDSDGKWRKSEYLSKEVIKTCEDNIKFIIENAILMTKEEIEEFINYDYVKEMEEE